MDARKKIEKLKRLHAKNVAREEVRTEFNKAAAAAAVIGAKQPDGTVYAGLTQDGKQRIYVTPEDLDVCMTFNKAAQKIQDLNGQKAFGHDDWQIPSLDTLKVLQKNQNEGALKGTFSSKRTSEFLYQDWYWSTTPDGIGCTLALRLSDGYEFNHHHKDGSYLNCRPVRLTPVKRTRAKAAP
jgi:hypothetical protein